MDKDMVCTCICMHSYNETLLSQKKKKKKNDIQPFPTNTDGPRGYHAKTNTLLSLCEI